MTECTNETGGILGSGQAYSGASQRKGRGACGRGIRHPAVSAGGGSAAAAMAAAVPSGAGGAAGGGGGTAATGRADVDAAAAGRGGAGGTGAALPGGDSNGAGAAVRRGDGLLPVCGGGYPEPGVSHGTGRLPHRRVRYGGAAGRGQHQSAGYLLRHHPYRTGAAGAFDGGTAPAVPGGQLLQHPPAGPAGAGQDHSAAGSDPGTVRRCRGRPTSSGGGGGRAGGDRRYVSGHPPDGAGQPHRCAGRLSQGAGHPHSAAVGQPAGHCRGRDHCSGGSDGHVRCRQLRGAVSGHHPCC